MQINFKDIPHQEQRYPTVGDYWLDGDTWQFRISKMSDWRYEILVLIHEIVEWVWVQYKEIKLEHIDALDIQFEKDREEGKHAEDEEPGDGPQAPYHWAHQKQPLLSAFRGRNTRTK